MSEQENKKSVIPSPSSQILDLILDVILDLMRAERGSVMLLDDKCQELTIRSSRGLKNKIAEQSSVRLGHGVSGKVAASGQSVFLKGRGGDSRIGIDPDDLTNPEVNTSWILPIKFRDQTIGTININFTDPNHEVSGEQEFMIKGILNRFFEYLIRNNTSSGRRKGDSQFYMMSMFREYHTLREMRIVFDYIFQLTADLLGTKKKGVMLLKKPKSVFFDLVLGYGVETEQYREVYEKLLFQLKKSEIKSALKIRIFKSKDFSSASQTSFQEDFLILVPLPYLNSIEGDILLLADETPLLSESVKNTVQSVCNIAAGILGESVPGQKLQDITLTDSLTGTYNYGLWWRRLHEELSRARRLKDAKISLIVFDVDHLNRFNLTYGYLMGDQLLRVIADRIKGCLRPIDIVGRIGGEEFGVALIGAGKEDAIMVGERIFKSISGIPDEMRIKFSSPLTLSGGMSGFPDDTDSPGKLVEMAKTALVSAKIMGGNCIKLFEQAEE